VRFLVDANVLSEATKPNPDPHAIAWLTQHETELAINAIILGELRFGILSLPQGKRRRELLAWLEAGVRYLEILNFDAETAGHWAILLADLKRKGRAMPLKDSLIAATARQFDLPIATRNVRDFTPANVKLINPFSS
jgi:toxin FitB